MRIELVYSEGCPNIDEARANIAAALRQSGLPQQWKEWSTTNPACPGRLRQLGSPTILVDGRDVAPGVGTTTDSCRIYPTESGYAGSPSVPAIAAALVASAAPLLPRWRSAAASIPAIGTALLPNVACPSCWPAYTGLLGSIGLSFLTETRYLFALTLGAIVLSLGSLAFRARSRREFGPLIVGVIAGTFVLVSKFVLDVEPAMYFGIAGLIGASAWNSWPRHAEACASCQPLVGDLNAKSSH